MYYGNRKYLTSFLSLTEKRKAPRNDTKKSRKKWKATLLNFKSNTASI